MNQLFSPLTIKHLHLKNRLVLSPMCMYNSTDGFAEDFHLVHLGSRAIGGFGLLIQEATAVAPEGRITHRDLGIWKDEHITKLKEIVAYCHKAGSAMGIQLAHAGRKASNKPPYDGRGQLTPDHPNGWQTVAPSAIPFHHSEVAPTALDQKGIDKVIADFAAATRRAKRAGYDVIEIHAAHGYLLHEFYSPLSNTRQDQYGGSFENRIRLLLEVIEAVKAEWGADKPLFVRISATDWHPDGWTIDDSVKLAQILKTKGVDLIDCSTGANMPGLDIPVAPNYQVSFAEQIKQQTGIATSAVGLITKAQQAEEILQNKQADLITIGREALRNPYTPLHFAHVLKADEHWPINYDWAVGKH